MSQFPFYGCDKIRWQTGTQGRKGSILAPNSRLQFNVVRKPGRNLEQLARSTVKSKGRMNTGALTCTQPLLSFYTAQEPDQDMVLPIFRVGLLSSIIQPKGKKKKPSQACSRSTWSRQCLSSSSRVILYCVKLTIKTITRDLWIAIKNWLGKPIKEASWSSQLKESQAEHNVPLSEAAT